MDDQWRQSKFTTIASNHSHRIDIDRLAMVTALIDGETCFANSNQVGQMPDLSTIPKPPQSIEDAKSYLSWLTGFSEFHSAHRESRITTTIKYVSQLELKSVSASMAASHINLSESRFLHLFKQQIGIPFRRYLLWARLIDTIDAIVSGNDLTMAAHLGGFADSAHFSRTFRRNFGLTPADIFKNSRNIQVITENKV